MTAKCNSDSRTSLLTHVEQVYRSILSSLFLTTVRRGIVAPEALVDNVRSHLIKQANRGFSQQKNRAILQAILEHPQEACAFAAYCLEHESGLMAVALSEVNHANAEVFVSAWLQSRPATEAQLEQLRRLGYKGRVGNLYQASALIKGAISYRKGDGVS